MNTPSGAIVDAVLCNFNQARWLGMSLGQLARQTTPLRRIHVVDNASTDDSLARIEEAARTSPVPYVIHRRPVNEGGAGGFAYGTAQAAAGTPDFVLLLDGDAFLDERAVEHLTARALARPEVGIIGPKLYLGSADARDWTAMAAGRVIQEVGGLIDWEGADFVLRHHRLDEATSQLDAGSADVDYVAACTLLARTEAIARCGTMDPSFFIYWDDIDWCARVRAAGYAIEAFAGAASWHVGGGRVRTSLLPTYYHWRNRIRFFGEHGPASGRPDARDRAVRIGLRAAFTCRWFGQTGTATLIERAVAAGLAGERGPVALPPRLLAVEPPSTAAPAPAPGDGLRRVEGLAHVLELPDDVRGLDPDRTVVADRFGKRLWLREAVSARAAFDAWLPGRLAETSAGGGRA